MAKSFLKSQARRIRRNYLFALLVCCVPLVVVTACTWRYCLNLLLGAATVGAGNIESIAGPEFPARSLVTVHGEDVKDSGAVIETQHGLRVVGVPLPGRKEISDRFFLLRLKDHMVVVRTADDNPGLEYTGTLVRPSDDFYWGDEDARAKQARANAFSLALRSEPARGQKLVPFLLDTTVSIRLYGLLSLLGLAAYAFLVLHLPFKGKLRLFLGRDKPAALQQLGESDCASIDEEAASQDAIRLKNAFLLRSWILKLSSFGVQPLRLRELDGGYKKVHETAKGGGGVNYSYSVALVSGMRLSEEIPASEKEADNFLGQLAKRAPWAVVGSGDDVRRSWEKEPEQTLEKSKSLRAALGDH